MSENTRTYTWTDPAFDPEKVKHLSGLEYLQAIARGDLPAAPIGATLGMERPHLEDVQEGRVVFRLRPQGFHYNPIGSVHGGVYATLLDSAVACAIHSTLPAGATYTTLELKVNYLRPLLEGGAGSAGHRRGDSRHPADRTGRGPHRGRKRQNLCPRHDHLPDSPPGAALIRD
ncbi:PaaI family thioesterase [Deinococcus sp. VB343]|uniref:PaaI family thioesterase n=1 Tax=Deinococcus sp. VB343 TaxID=3385567 RepID=UPI003CD0C798